MDKKYTPIPFSKKIFPFVLTVLSSIFFLISLHTYTNLGIFLESDAVYSDRIFGIMLFVTVCLIVFLLYRETFESEKIFFAMVVAMGALSYFVATLRFIYLTAAVFLVLAILKSKLKKVAIILYIVALSYDFIYDTVLLILNNGYGFLPVFSFLLFHIAVLFIFVKGYYKNGEAFEYAKELTLEDVSSKALEDLHSEYKAGIISAEEYEERKSELTKEAVYESVDLFSSIPTFWAFNKGISFLEYLGDYKDSESRLEKAKTVLENYYKTSAARKKIAVRVLKIGAIVLSALALTLLLFFFAIRPLVSLATGNYKVFIKTYGVENFEIPGDPTVIKDKAFSGCDKLESVTIPDSVTEIGAYAFEDCYSLKDISISKYVTKIETTAFSFCSFNNFNIHADATSATRNVLINAANVNVYGDGDSAVSLGAFSGLTNVSKIVFGEGITTIYPSLFTNTYSAAQIYLPTTLEYISANSLEGVYISRLVVYAETTKSTSLLSAQVENLVVLGSGDSQISSYAFSSLRDLQTVTIGSGITSIGQYVFPTSANISWGGLDLYISKDLKTMSRQTFADPLSSSYSLIPLNTINYEGNAFAWANIENSIYVDSYASASMKYFATIDY